MLLDASSWEHGLTSSLSEPALGTRALPAQPMRLCDSRRLTAFFS